MNGTVLVLLAAATVSAAQTAPAPKATPKAGATATATTHRPAGTGTAGAGVKLPPGVPVVKGIVKSAFSLRYEDFKVGTGALAEPGKLYTVHYTGWLASDGKKFDSSYDHRQPVVDKDGKPENDAEGKPKLGEAQPLTFPQGRGRLIPGWDQGFEGMHVGGKRRLFIPYQLAYGAGGRPPVIPAKADLIFDVELMDVKEMPAQPGGPGMGAPGGMARPMPRPGGASPSQAPGSQAPGSAAPGTPSSPVAPPTPPPAGSAKPEDPTKPTVDPNSATPPPPAPKTDQPASTPDKPTNPSQPN